MKLCRHTILHCYSWVRSTIDHLHTKPINISDKQFYIAGVDISFIKGDDVNACAALVILSFPQLQARGSEMRRQKLLCSAFTLFSGNPTPTFSLFLVFLIKKRVKNVFK